MTTVNFRDIWELSPTQRGLVDNCFEEGQYETAIGTLDQLRASEFKPWPPHLRQLIYISLQSAEKPTKRDEVDTSIQSSPSKIVKQQQIQMSMNLVPANVVVNARRLLMAYLRTSSPSTLSRALPRRKSHPDSVGHSEGDSIIAKRAVYIVQCQDCWELLRSDSLSRKNTISSALKSKRRKHSDPTEGQSIVSTNSEASPSLTVAENAWSLLEWLVGLFERDEEGSSVLGVRYSVLLADQLVDNEAKLHFDTPVAIVGYCLIQEQVGRQRLGGRLLSLLVNSTCMAELDLNVLVNVVYTRIQSLDQLAVLLSHLGNTSTIQVLKFRVGLCQKIIQRMIGGLGLVPASHAPKPQPRIRHRLTEVTDRADSRRDTRTTAAESPVPSTSEVLQLFQASTIEQTISDTSLSLSWCKFQLLLAYGTLQVQIGPDNRDQEWTKALVETLPRIVREVLEQGGSEASVYQRLLESQVVTWKQRLS